ncbi:insulinase family protein [bacterium]|nr:insulinase family protein [bacterium]
MLSADAYDLSKARVEKLENGLTVMILEDRTQPLVSTQVLYKVGGRNECTGATGLAHFLEHMAFRATKNFPETQVVSRIYAEGGEWHGYTWIDQTTYFETVPIEDFDLVLQIQADRMANAVISAADVEAERGSVMTELRGYENDPSSVLSDAVVATSFQQHPYRYNVIGWPSDVEKITHKDLVDFYKRFYSPSNAVLAISGDITSTEALFKVRKYFDSIPGNAAESVPRTVEPPQTGERRILLRGSGSLNYFQISWHAPAANDPDYPAFLLLQAVLSGANGVNFRQDGDKDVDKGTRLDGIDESLETFFFSSADPYLFTIKGHADTSVSREQIEEKIESKIREIREHLVSDEELEKAKKTTQSELIFDIETTEDAAHQMAFFEGIDAFTVLQKLPDLVSRVSAEEIQRTAEKYLQPQLRTIGWYLGDSKKISQSKLLSHRFAKATVGSVAVQSSGISAPRVKTLKSGTTLIVQEIRRTPAVFLRVLVPSNTIEPEGDYSRDDPLWGYTSITRRILKQDTALGVAEVRKLFDKPFERSEPDPALQDDPEFRLNSTLEELLGLKKRSGPVAPVLIVMTGDLEAESALAMLSGAFGNLRSGKRKTSEGFSVTERERIIRIPGKAQSQLGYAVPATAPSESMALAWKMLRYIMTHDYEGRLGMELIARQGLLYGISSEYRSDGRHGWVWITTGVNPDKLFIVKQRFQELMRGLVSNPPSSKEIAEARNYLIGRRKTSYQSNEEISGFLAQEWMEQGRLLTEHEFEKRVNSVTDEQVRNIVQQFLAGVTVVVDCSI